MFSKQLTFAIVAEENILATAHIDPGQVGKKIPLLTTWVETLAADKHVIAKLPLVSFWIIKLTRLTSGVCMKVRFKSKVTRGFSFSPFRGSLAAPTNTMKIKKNLWEQGRDRPVDFLKSVAEIWTRDYREINSASGRSVKTLNPGPPN